MRSTGSLGAYDQDAQVRDSLYCYTGWRAPPLRPDTESDSNDERLEAQLYEVRIMDNNHNTYQEVMDVSMLTLGVTEEQAYAIAWEVDHLGSCVVAQAPRDVAEQLADMIRTIGIEVQVNPINEKSD